MKKWQQWATVLFSFVASVVVILVLGNISRPGVVIVVFVTAVLVLRLTGAWSGTRGSFSEKEHLFFSGMHNFLLVGLAVLYFTNFLPLVDKGHRLFAVPNEDAARVVATVIGEIGGLEERFTFDAGTTHQMLFWDNTTVLVWHDPGTTRVCDDIVLGDLPQNGMSLAVKNPGEAVRLAVRIFNDGGYRALVHEEVGGVVPVTSDALCGWTFVFRRHVMKMGPPPNKRKLLN